MTGFLWYLLRTRAVPILHTVFAALGLSLVVAQSALAITIMKYVGAAYLFYLGIKSFIN